MENVLNKTIDEVFKTCTPALRQFLFENSVTKLSQLFFMKELRMDQNYELRREVDLVLGKEDLALLDSDPSLLNFKKIKTITKLFEDGLICDDLHESYIGKREMRVVQSS